MDAGADPIRQAVNANTSLIRDTEQIHLKKLSIGHDRTNVRLGHSSAAKPPMVAVA